MKVKCIDSNLLSSPHELTIGKEYEVLKEDCNCYTIKNDNGVQVNYYRCRFEKSLEDQLKEAESLVESLKVKIKEQIPKLKVGQKWRHQDGYIYMIFKLQGKFALVCVDGHNGDFSDIGATYGGKLHDKIEDVFYGAKHLFTLIK
jgi:hypothetical protein